MFNVVFYEFNKRPNSTKRPTSSTPSAIYPCSMKAASSLTSPLIELKLSGSTVPKWNYCYIQDLGQRYYYVERTYYELGIWTFQLTVDVLATYYADINASSQYILRSATHYATDLIDTMYPVKPAGTDVEEYAGITVAGETFKYGAQGSLSTGQALTVSNYFNRPMNQGYVVVGIKGNNVTGVTYYAMTTAVFNTFINATFSVHPSMSDDTTSAFANAVFDPLQYVTSARWFPYMGFASTATTVSSVKVGSQSVSLGSSTAYVLDDIYIIKWECQVDLPTHPSASSYSYMKLAPYTELTLYMQPFGFIPLDTTRLYGSTKLTIGWKVDYRTGACSLELSGTAADESDLFFVNSYQYGVEMPISSLHTNWLGGLITSGMQMFKNVLTGGSSIPSDVQAAHDYVASHPEEYEPDFVASFNNSYSGTSSVDNMIDMTHAAMGQLQTVGAVDSFLGYTDMIPKIYANFYQPVDMDIQRFGRPYSSRGNMSTESGFVLCMNASVDFEVKQPLPSESRAVIMALNTGIYME